MNGPDGNTQNPDQLAEDQTKIRNCLRCSTPFESAWPGERVCRRCKGSGVWKRGLTTNFSNKRDLRRTTPTNSEH